MLSAAGNILTQTFLHVPGVGPATEKALWKCGISSWSEFLRSSSTIPIALRSRRDVYRFIERSYEALRKADAHFFGRHLPRQEWWRLYPHFESKAVFLDIETTGLSHYYDDVTLVGLFDGKRARTLVAGCNLKSLQVLLEPYDIVVTFNGTLFDIPFLKAKIPTLRLPPIHLDLRYILKRLGHTGGLKQIEGRLRIKRSREVGDIDGLMATVLWARYLRGDIAALEQLIRYNIADITSLQSLMSYSCQQLALRLLHDGRSQPKGGHVQRPKKVFVQVKRNESGINLVVGRHRVVLEAPNVGRTVITVTDLLVRIPSRLKTPKSVGIDLRASEIRTTGWALLTGDKVETRLIKTDEEIVQETILQDPDIISIDSPLTLPAGRCCTRDSCQCRTVGIVRECERALWRRGVKVFPCLLPSMQKLTERGIRLARAFRERGYRVIESYPGAAQDIMRIPRKKASLEDLTEGLGAFGIRGNFASEQTSHDELDAITSGVVGYFYLAGEYEALGNECEEYLIVPRLDQLLLR